MKTKTTQPDPITLDSPDPPTPASVATPEEHAPTRPDSAPSVEAGIEYLLRKNASLYRRLAE